MPRAIELASKLYGKIIFLCINLALLWSFLLKISWSVVLLCGFLVLAPIAQKWKFAVSFIIVGFFGLKDVEFGIWNFGEENRAHVNGMISNLYNMLGENMLSYRLFIILGSACLFFIITSVVEKLKIRWSFFWYLGVWFALLMIADSIPQSTIGSVYFWGLFCVVARCFFGAIYLHKALKGSKKISLMNKFLFPLQGALIGTGNNFLRNPSVLEDQGGKDKKEHIAVCLLKSVKLLLWTRILTFGSDAINCIVFGKFNAWLPDWIPVNLLGWSHPVMLGFKKYNELDVPIIQSWVAVCLHSLDFMLLLCTFSGITIAFIRMNGVYIPRDTFRPYAAKTFNEFLRRLLFYYSEILVHIFLYPIWRYTRIIHPYKKWRLVITLVATVGVCGWFIHIIFMPGYFVLSGGVQNGFYFFLQWIPYFALLGLASAVSATEYVKKIADKILPSILHMPLIFVFYSLLLVTAHGYPLDGGVLENWQYRFEFICSLFGLS